MKSRQLISEVSRTFFVPVLLNMTSLFGSGGGGSLFGLDPNASSEWEKEDEELYPVEESTNVLVGTKANPAGRKLLVAGDTQLDQVFGNSMLVGTTSNPNSRKLMINGSAEVTGQLTLGSTITNGSGAVSDNIFFAK